MHTLSEENISVKYITPALTGSRWDEAVQIRRQVSFTNGRIIVRGRLVSRGKAKKADFILYYQHFPIAVAADGREFLEGRKQFFIDNRSSAFRR
jgi:type I restriction enzyme R subunit